MSKLELFARTETGCVRERNEDAFVIASLARGERGLVPRIRIQELVGASALVAVCDGMGGATAGDVAARLATDSLYGSMMLARPFVDALALQRALLVAVTEAHSTVVDHARRHEDCRGMGTTMTAGAVFETDLHLVHVGDSRAYLRRGRVLQQLTSDHTLVEKMVADGVLSAAEAPECEHRNVLLQALGLGTEIVPESVSTSIFAGDVLLICSDGLTGPLSDRQILDVMLCHEDPMRCARALTEAACASGGPDNVTVAVGHFVGEGLPAPGLREPIVAHRSQHQLPR